MRTFTPAQFVPFFSSPRAVLSATSLKSLAIAFAAFSLFIASAPATFAQTPAITATAYENPTDQALDTAESYLVIDFNNGPGDTINPSSDYLFQYDWNPSGTAPSGWDLVSSVFTTVSSPSTVSGTVDATYYASFGEHYVDGFSYDGNSQDDQVNLDGNSWNYFQAGSSPSNDDLTSALAGVWTSSESGADQFTLTPGSVDGWEWGGLDANYNPLNVPVVPTAPAPELSTGNGMFIGLLLFACIVAISGSGRVRRDRKI